MKKVLALLMTILVICFLCSCAEQRTSEYNQLITDYKAKLFAQAEKESLWYEAGDNPYDGNNFFVKKNNFLEYDVELYSEKIHFSFNGTRTLRSNYKIIKSYDLNNRYKDVSEKSLGKVKSFIQNSGVFSRPDDILNSLEKVNLKSANFENKDFNGAYFSENDETIYVSANAPIDEYLITKEFIHSLSFLSHKYSSNTSNSNRFYNAFTEIIACSISEKGQEEYFEDYSKYYKYIYPYIFYMEDVSLKTYFYGSNLVDFEDKKMTRDEFLFLVDSVNEIEEHSDSEKLLNHMFLNLCVK